MRRRVLCFLACLCAGIIIANIVAAKIWLLPDYSMRQLNSHRVNTPGSEHGVQPSPQNKPTYICSDYGFTDPDDLKPGEYCAEYYYGLRTCCAEVKCESDYVYTENECVADGLVPSGAVCTADGEAKYTACKCPDKFQYDSNNCPAPEGISCTEINSTLYDVCSCQNAEIVDCKGFMVCKEYCDNAQTKCTVCEQPECGEGTRWGGEDVGCIQIMCEPGYVLSGNNCVLAEAYVMEVNAPSDNAYLGFDIWDGSFQVNWGDGTVDSSTSHTYSIAGTYTVGITGAPKYLKFIAPSETAPTYITKLIRLNLSSVISSHFSLNCSQLTGTIPDLPPNLQYGDIMFKECSGLTGTVPTLPSSLTSAGDMFSFCTGLTGFAEGFSLPSSLQIARSMFNGSTNLNGKITYLPDTITNANYMFKNATNISSDCLSMPTAITAAQTDVTTGSGVILANDWNGFASDCDNGNCACSNCPNTYAIDVPYCPIDGSLYTVLDSDTSGTSGKYTCKKCCLLNDCIAQGYYVRPDPDYFGGIWEATFTSDTCDAGCNTGKIYYKYAEALEFEIEPGDDDKIFAFTGPTSFPLRIKINDKDIVANSSQVNNYLSAYNKYPILFSSGELINTEDGSVYGALTGRYATATIDGIAYIIHATASSATPINFTFSSYSPFYKVSFLHVASPTAAIGGFSLEGSTVEGIRLLNLNLPKLLTIGIPPKGIGCMSDSNVMQSIHGMIPNFPPDAGSAVGAFRYCERLVEGIPELPDSLIYAGYMFAGTNLQASCLPKPAGITTTQTSVATNSGINLSTEWQGYASDCDNGNCTCTIP